MENNRSSPKMAGCIQHFAQTVVRCLFLWQLALTVLTSANRYPFFEEVYQPENNLIKLKNMLLDQNTGALYVGSVNRLYKLSPDLGIETTIETGPRQDNPGCVTPPVDCDYERTTTDNINKLLVIDQDRLFVCGSIYQGSCDIWSLSDLGLLGNDSYQEIAANTPDGTSVAFVAPGPLGTAVLYVGTSHGQWIDKAVPTVSSRVLPVENTGRDLFEILEDATNFLKAEIKIPSNLITNSEFNIDYLYGFSNTKFSYFVAIQPKDPEATGIQPTYYTKIARICQQDIAYYSYIELPLSCKQGDTDYNVAQSAYVATIGSALASSSDFEVGEKVLFVTFSESSVDEITPTDSSAICMYSIKRINEQFNNRRKECALGQTDTTDIPWLRSTRCSNPDEPAQNLVNRINTEGTEYCHDQDIFRPLGGNTPIAAQAFYTDDSILSAIAVTAHLDKTVIFLGDQLGHLKKLWVLSPSEAVMYEEEAMLSGDPRPVVRNGITFSPDKNFIYFMTERKIHRIPVEDCSTHTTCEDCLGVGNSVGDPYCGWCSLQKNCTRRSQTECAGSADPSNLRWLRNLDQCIAILSVEPPNTPSTRTQELTLTTRGLPQLDPTTSFMYKCKFGDLPLQPATVVFTTTTSSVRCLTPPIHQLPSTVQGVLMVTLSLHSTETNKLIVNTTFDFYDCSAFDSCTQCVADYLCNWCVFENRCMGNASSCSASGVIVGQQVQIDTEMKGKDYCPRIEDTPEILIPAGEPEFQHLTVNVARLPVMSGYTCVLRHKEWATEKTTAGIVLSDTKILCAYMKYNYIMDENVLIADLQIRGSSFVLDNPTMLTVTLYKCGVKRTNCGKCLLADAKFSCGWCKPSQMCSITTACTDGQGWLSGQDLCPNPNITSFSPTSGHVAGGTRVIIEGFNLGQTASDIKQVTVAGMPCQTIEYKRAERIVCITNASTAGAASGPVVVMIGRDEPIEQYEVTTMEKHFSFVVPIITGAHPLLGPKAGGSKVILTGKSLNAGCSRSITVAGRPCNITEPTNLSADVSSCVTSASTGLIQGPIVMIFDLLGTAVSSSNFSYTENPVITMQEREQTILSGGLDLPITGIYLDVVQEPKMRFRIERTRQFIRPKRQADQQLVSTITTKCTINHPASMTCKSPNLKSPELANAFTFDDSTSPPSFFLQRNNIFFVMDAVTIPSSKDFQVFVDPEYFMFDKTETVAYMERKILEIKGRYINATYREGDVIIKVGNLSCRSLMMQPEKADSLTCEAPEHEAGQTYDVVVHHGNVVVTVGRLEYLSEGLPWPLIFGTACGVALILLILLFVICIWRRISANEHLFKKMETQRNEMEIRAMLEYKDAFAEQQITVLTVSSDVEGSGIPFRDYRDYVARLLFPENPSHPVLGEIPIVRENISGTKRNDLEKGLVQFGNLISNHIFLAIFVRTLESQKTLALRDLSNIASLLVIALHNKMEFLTQNMKFLLQEHIKLCMKEGEPQQLLRRSEAVVEKLVSHWLSILMYDSLKDNMGKPLFHLFYAIKQQIDKGPVDVVTGEARYGLSEIKVIRKQIDFKTLNIYATSWDITSEPIQLKVLDCDTISQTKDKILDAIYKSCPFSKRPTQDELDLEWSDRPDGPSSMILLDDDGRGRCDGEWKRINTLAYYQVPDGATLRLVRVLPNIPARQHGLGTPQSPVTSASPMIDQEQGVKLWHLVKQADSGSISKGERDQKMMAEICLPRLLTTKGILQQFVDELLETIFNGESDVPLAVKYLFDFLDEQATSRSITKSDVAHAWKSNYLQLQFWVNLIMNPTILFDINKTDTVDACVSIIGQTLIDSCSVAEQHLTKDSPYNKLLYAKDIPQYKQWVVKYYKDISDMASVSDQDMSAMLAAHSSRYQNEFQPLNALNELYFCYACIFKSEILQSLDEDNEAQKQGLRDKLEDIFRLMADSA